MTTWYVYDELNRLLAVSESASNKLDYASISVLLQASSAPNDPSALGSMAPLVSWTHAFAYDQIGNMTWNSDVGTYSYTDHQPHAVSVAGSKQYFYDANGNVSRTRGRELEFDYEDRLKTVENGLKRTHFKYDYQNERVERDSWSTRTVYMSELYDCRANYLRFSTHCYKNILVGGAVIAKVDEKGRSYYFHSNYLGSIISITDHSGREAARLTYEPFGAEKGQGKFPFNYRFTGQYYDDGADLYFYKSRFYDPRLARFVSPDPVVPVIGNPQTLNRYTYGANNPINYVDPDGHFAWFIPIIAGAVLGGVNAGVHHGNILTGMAQGAIAGAFISGAGAIAPAGGGLGAVGVYSAAGAGAGATNAALWGGDIGKAALYGAVFGAVGYETSTLGQLNIFGNSTVLGGTANYITTAAIRNSIMTGAIASYQGRDVGKAMLEGAMNGAISSAANTVIGHALGIILAGTGEGSWYTDSQGHQAFIYLHGKGMGAITFGNVIVGDAGFLAAQREDGYLNLDHEFSHVEQGMTLSVGYLFNPSPSNFFTFFGAHPWAMASSVAISGIGSGFSQVYTHRYDVLECYWMEVPDCSN
jgi:RHS repeat-associated protein